MWQSWDSNWSTPDYVLHSSSLPCFQLLHVLRPDGWEGLKGPVFAGNFNPILLGFLWKYQHSSVLTLGLRQKTVLSCFFHYYLSRLLGYQDWRREIDGQARLEDDVIVCLFWGSVSCNPCWLCSREWPWNFDPAWLAGYRRVLWGPGEWTQASHEC